MTWWWRKTSGGPGIASEVPAKYVYDAMFLFAKSRSGLRRIDHDAARGSDRADPPPPGPISNLGGAAAVTDVITSAIATGIKPGRLAEGPSGARPKRAFSPRQHLHLRHLAGGLDLLSAAAYVMVVNYRSRACPEIRLGNIFAPPVEITFEPWVKAWATACTGLNCEGLSRGFWNSVRITIPSVILSIAIASVNGLCAGQLALSRAPTPSSPS